MVMGILRGNADTLHYILYDVIQYDFLILGDIGVQPEEAGEEALGGDDRKPETTNYPLARLEGESFLNPLLLRGFRSCILSCNFLKHTI